MPTNKLIPGLIAWALSMGALWVTWGYALSTTNVRREVTAPIPLLAVGMLIAVVLFIVGTVLLVGAMRAGKPPIVR